MWFAKCHPLISDRRVFAVFAARSLVSNRHVVISSVTYRARSAMLSPLGESVAGRDKQASPGGRSNRGYRRTTAHASHLFCTQWPIYRHGRLDNSQRVANLVEHNRRKSLDIKKARRARNSAGIITVKTTIERGCSPVGIGYILNGEALRPMRANLLVRRHLL